MDTPEISIVVFILVVGVRVGVALRISRARPDYFLLPPLNLFLLKWARNLPN
ncbi:hypothetical protein [uncultured Alloprevotella sp.]|uniref:hypothetical protein n=1 Tax=uncultured Alloprevotella sp. TaxID=1283315 RepID=UPI002609E48C|nr:hypothetical protein [uncultured Alloprevotella sp.]